MFLDVCRKGSNDLRKIRHTAAFEKHIYLIIPAIRMFCKSCHAGFVWQYSFVGTKKRYSHSFQKHAIAHSARFQKTPASTVQRMHDTSLPMESHRLQQQAWQEAKAQPGLVLGVDDFAIKKGHTYNTGIHNLKGETLLDILPGRKLDELRVYAQQHPDFLLLNPKAVVMDLAPAYHTWIAESFPGAIRIADRFHVHGYVIESVQAVRKEVQSTLSPRAKARLKANHRLLNPKAESLSVENKEKLDELLSYSSLLRKVWVWKESFTEWYDCPPNVVIATLGFHRWCEQGEQIDHQAVMSCLKTMRNWEAEIVNYHRCRWTNATVEGRHNRIKAFHRRHYFTRNRSRYIAGILVECNRNHFLD